jgi:hypothetical protein
VVFWVARHDPGLGAAAHGQRGDFWRVDVLFSSCKDNGGRREWRQCVGTQAGCKPRRRAGGSWRFRRPLPHARTGLHLQRSAPHRVPARPHLLALDAPTEVPRARATLGRCLRGARAPPALPPAFLAHPFGRIAALSCATRSQQRMHMPPAPRTPQRAAPRWPAETDGVRPPRGAQRPRPAFVRRSRRATSAPRCKSSARCAPSHQPGYEALPS